MCTKCQIDFAFKDVLKDHFEDNAKLFYYMNAVGILLQMWSIRSISRNSRPIIGVLDVSGTSVQKERGLQHSR